MPFFSVLWPLLGDVLQIIALTLNVPSPSCKHFEAKGAILRIKKIGLSQNLGIYVGGAKGVMWLHLCRKFAFQEVDESD